MCWIKSAEEGGKIKWYKMSLKKESEKPECVNFPGDDWDTPILKCTGKHPMILQRNVQSVFFILHRAQRIYSYH